MLSNYFQINKGCRGCWGPPPPPPPPPPGHGHGHHGPPPPHHGGPPPRGGPYGWKAAPSRGKPSNDNNSNLRDVAAEV